MRLGLPCRRAPGKTILGGRRERTEPGKVGLPSRGCAATQRRGSPSCFCGSQEKHLQKGGCEGQSCKGIRALKNEPLILIEPLGRVWGQQPALVPAEPPADPISEGLEDAQHPLISKSPLGMQEGLAQPGCTCRTHCPALRLHTRGFWALLPPFLGSQVQGAPVGSSPVPHVPSGAEGRRVGAGMCGSGMWEQVLSSQIIEPGSSCPRNPIQVSIPA